MEKGTELPSVSQKDSTRFLCQAKKGNKEINNNILTTLTDEENYCKEKETNQKFHLGDQSQNFPLLHP